MLINSPNISGSLTVTGNSVISGSLNVLGSITGAITGSATTASYVEYTNVANKPALVSGSSQITYSGLTGIPSGIVSGSSQVSFNGIVDKPTLVSGSSQVTYSGLTGIPSGIISGSAQITGFGIFATTGSNQFNGNQAITGSLTTTGTIVAQTLNVQQVTSSIVYSSGSNIFGNSVSNIQQLTGSVGVTGSLTVTTNGVELQVTNTGVNLGNALTDSHIISGSLRVNPSGLFVSGSGNVGINTITPTERLSVVGAGLFGSHGAGSYSLAISNNDQSNVRLRITNAGSGGQAFSIVGGNPGASNAGLAIYDETNAATRLYISSTGAATFSSSVTAASIASNNGGFRLKESSQTSSRNWIIGNDWLVYGDLGIGQSTTQTGSSYTYPLYINPSGNVGIGTPSPTGGKLQVNNGTNLNVGINTTTVDSVTTSRISSFNDAVSASVGLVINGTPLVFTTSDTERLRITSGGEVGIGVTPTSGNRFWIRGSSTSSSDTSLFIQNSTPSALFLVRNDGNVGIANTSPNKKLEITTGNGVSDGIRITYNNVTSEGLDITYLNTGATTTSFDSIYNSNSAVMQFRMKTGGTPVTALSILGSGAATFSSSVTSNGFIVGADQQFKWNGFNSATAYITSNAGFNGNYNGVGIFSNPTNANSLPAWALDLGGLDGPNIGGVTDGFTISRKASGGSWTSRFVINSTGNVGIGTSSPSTTLDINGSVRFRGSIYDQFEYIASGNFTNGTYYNIVEASQIGTGIYILEGYVDTYSAGAGIYFMRFASVPFYFWEVGSNSTTFVDLPPVLGTGHHLGNPFPLFRLQQTLGGAGIYLQFNPSATWTGIDNSGGKTFQVRLKRIGS